MDPASAPAPDDVPQTNGDSQNSQTAQDFIASQLSLEADAREALPYQFDTCTKPLGPLRQSVYACLTCTPPPASPHQQFTPAGVCYSCSISCHGEHTLVELFSKRDFVCDCGTTRIENSGTPCSLRHNVETGRKGGVVKEKAREGNQYNQNFQGKFCACGDEYDPEMEKGTMFQCLGLGTLAEGGCGEDWWHPECLMGLPRIKDAPTEPSHSNGVLETVKEETDDTTPAGEAATTEPPTHDDGHGPPGFPDEDDFDHLICYKCVNAFPWIKQYAASQGFLTAGNHAQAKDTPEVTRTDSPSQEPDSRKRKAEDVPEDSQELKKLKPDESHDEATTTPQTNGHAPHPAKHALLPPAPTDNNLTLYLKEDFRDHLCRCPACFPLLAKHKQLLEEEEAYEPPLSESDAGSDMPGHRANSINSGSLLERGEAALSSMDRVRAIEGVMAYNHVRDKVKDFLKPFAESGKPVGAEHIKAYFAKLRGDEQAIREAAVGASSAGEKDHRREQGGY
ncbi:putative zinc finger in N-recognin-domain-containing protein [Neohortaea acidophila]|uniref:Putative zinc finger in N-recognin-domain-containing protein n=1 Tax=Neohortaea acidophila TaxID=245834 RepID=A0A6A6Q572_9PEZI|nr:putative zinc finger in N-recognin-domain-containing protein [Neohortaea acidophila]KAF2487096.1 putative zinc finger in N-recognin-domain-containing protein [Neohortaea acidophila]